MPSSRPSPGDDQIALSESASTEHRAERRHDWHAALRRCAGSPSIAGCTSPRSMRCAPATAATTARHPCAAPRGRRARPRRSRAPEARFSARRARPPTRRLPSRAARPWRAPHRDGRVQYQRGARVGRGRHHPVEGVGAVGRGRVVDRSTELRRVVPRQHASTRLIASVSSAVVCCARLAAAP